MGSVDRGLIKSARSHCLMVRRRSVSIRRSTDDAITRLHPRKSCWFKDQFLCSTDGKTVSSFSNRRPKSKRLIQFFCSTAPQAFFRPDRRSNRPARADTVKDGLLANRQRRREASLTVASTLADLVIAVWKSAWSSMVCCQLLRSMSLPGPPFSTRSRFTGRTMASGFRRRYVPNAFSTDWRRKNRAVVEARPGRDSFRRFSSE